MDEAENALVEQFHDVALGGMAAQPRRELGLDATARTIGGSAPTVPAPPGVRPAPPVLIVGGFLTELLNYEPMRRRLIERGAASAVVAPIHLPDWIIASVVGFGPLLTRTALAILKARRVAGGAPLLVVGHSAGGLLARLATSPEPFDGRRGGVASSVATLVTLGTPHGLGAAGVRSPHRGIQLARSLDGSAPGAFFAPRTAYLTVGSDLVQPQVAPARWLWDRFRGRIFTDIVGPHLAAGGDGIVQVGASHLAGAEQMTFHDVRHGHIGGPWYGDAAIIDRWWPRAVDLWHGAMEARAADQG